MRPQNRPFVVEIKKTKRGGASAGPGASAPTAPATWAEQFEQATALNDTAARKAAEALFSAPRPAAPVRASAGPSDEPKPVDGHGRTGRILEALQAEIAPSEPVVSRPGFAADDEDAERPLRRGRPPSAPKVATAKVPPERIRAEPRPAPMPRAEPAPPLARTPVVKTSVVRTPVTVAAPLPVEDDATLAVVSGPARKNGWRRGGATLARGEKWKRRLPQVLR